MAQGGVLGNKLRVGYSPTISPLSYVTLTQVLNVVIPGLEFDKIDTSIHGSLMKRNMPGMGDVSETEITLLQDLAATDQQALFTLNAAQTTVAWRIEVPVTRGESASFVPFTFNGWVKGFRPGSPMSDKQTLVVTVVFDDNEFLMGTAAAAVLAAAA